MASLVTAAKGSLLAIGLLSLTDPSAGFAGAPSMAAMTRRGSQSVAPRVAPLHLSMRTEDTEQGSIDRMGFLRVAVAAASGLVASPVFAKGGDFAKQDFSGTGGSSQSSLGANDVPAAGKIDPYDNRQAAQAAFGEKMKSTEVLDEYKKTAFEAKEKIFAQLEKDIAKKDWKAAYDFVNRELFVLRRNMYPVSTRGLRAVSAAIKGGEPDKPATKLELAEKTFLASMNKCAVALNGENQGGPDWVRAGKALAKAEADWQKWVALIDAK